MKIGMISLMGNQPQRLSSHNAGWSFMLRSLLKQEADQVDFLKQTDDIHSYDMLCINNGINFKAGGWNFIGGPPKTLVSLLIQLQKFNGRLISFNEHVNLSDLVQSRNELVMLRNDDFPLVSIRRTDENPKLILGDSHSLSVYRPGWGLSRNDGKTLHGFLKDPQYYIDEDVTDLHLYFGNIDVRFHICRQPDPRRAFAELTRNYLDVIAKLISDGINVTVQGLIPIEDESRKIPGTGLYKGQPFYGTREERQSMVDLYNDAMKRYSVSLGFTFVEWDFTSPLDFNCMEARQSVHIRPSDYYYDEFTNTFNLE